VAKHQTFAATRLRPAEPREESIPGVNSLFEQPWWLDSVAPQACGAAVVRRGEDVVARLPYMRRRRLGLTTIVQPPLTQTLGPWLVRSEGKRAHRLETEKKLLEQLIGLLPRFDFFRQAFAPTLTNWLPFYWAGFEATVRITYGIDDLSDLDRVQSEFQEHVPARPPVAISGAEPLYPLINGRDPELQAFGANMLLYWEAIRLASEVSRVFDFEGSMLKPVEHFFRGFGGKPTPYLQVSKASLTAKSVLTARDVLGRRRRARG
jgi:hypothetical protein